jgi:hypothetical protein
MSGRWKTRKSKTPRTQSPSLRETFGEMILKKGSVLYHTSEEPFKRMSTKPMLFLSFHPSEWEGFSDNYITRVTLLKDVSLFFMIGGLYKSRVIPLLDKLINNPGANLLKQNDTNLECYANHLKQNKFDGWFSTIEGKHAVEVALINNDNFFSYSKSEPLIRNWNIGNYANNNNTFVPKKWGIKYPLCSLSNIIVFNINRRYKSEIDAYIKYGKNTYPNEYALQVIFETAQFNYHPGSDKFNIWTC